MHLSYWINFSLNKTFLFFFIFLLLSVSTLSEASVQGIYLAPKSADHGLEKVTLIIGVPHDYKERGIVLPVQGRCESNGSGEKLCKVYRYGNEYQLLDWIENAQIDGAYLSSVSLQLINGFSENEFKDHFYVFSAEGEYGYHAVLSSHQGDISLPEPDKRYIAYLNDLSSGKDKQNVQISFRSHLDPSFVSLYKVTQKWIDENIKENAEKERLWVSLINSLQFGESRGFTASESNGQLVFSGSIKQNCDNQSLWFCFEDKKTEHNYLVVRKQALSEKKSPSLFGLTKIQELQEHIDFKALCSNGHGAENGLKHVCQFITDNYKHYKYGANIKRYFRFKIFEILDILQTTGKAGEYCESENTSLSLVLTGGGVKAAYQTRLIDYLYGAEGKSDVLLENRSFLQDGLVQRDVTNVQPLKVDHVIGTSGGALLGLFVATHSSASSFSYNYSDILWSNDDKFITSLNIFPLVDLMRWLSFVVSVVIFSLVLSFVFHLPYTRDKFDLAPELSVKHQLKVVAVERDKPSRFWTFSIVWIVFMLGSPWVIDYVNGNVFQEHVPAVQGIFYFFYIFLAIYTDNNVVRLEKSRVIKGTMPIKWKVVALTGIVLTVLPVIYISRGTPVDIIEFGEPLYWRMTVPSFICVSGLFLIALFLHYYYVNRCSLYGRIGKKENPPVLSFLILVLVAALSFAIMYLLFNFQIAPILEVSPGFWAWHASVSVMVSMVVIYSGLSSHSPERLRNYIEPKIRFLLLPHPSKTLMLPLSRVSRVVMLFAVTWGWWNIVVAPGLYGNNIARDYLSCGWEKVSDIRLGALDEEIAQCSGNKKNDSLSLSAFYVAPATSLIKQSERYFLFGPDESQLPPDKKRLLLYRNQLDISSDSRWTQFYSDEINMDQVLQIAFASGSPFPIFAAHNVEISIKGAEESPSEWLVDGGYAHNIPIDAANMLGADRVLVLSSSPFVPEEILKEKTESVFGRMVANLPRLIPYFYGRSQVEDLLSAEDMIVATLAPTAPLESDDNWPLLTDFQGKVIKRMIDVAEKDINKRIGYVQNWGRPDMSDAAVNNSCDN